VRSVFASLTMRQAVFHRRGISALVVWLKIPATAYPALAPTCRESFVMTKICCESARQSRGRFVAKKLQHWGESKAQCRLGTLCSTKWHQVPILP